MLTGQGGLVVSPQALLWSISATVSSFSSVLHPVCAVASSTAISGSVAFEQGSSQLSLLLPLRYGCQKGSGWHASVRFSKRALVAVCNMCKMLYALTLQPCRPDHMPGSHRGPEHCRPIVCPLDRIFFAKWAPGSMLYLVVRGAADQGLQDRRHSAQTLSRLQ